MVGDQTAGDEELTGEHVNQARGDESTTPIGRVSDEYVRIVESLFKTRPVTLMIDDPASSIGDEPWRVCWTGHRDALVDAATELVRSRGAITLMDLYDELDFRGAPVHGDLSMMLGRHAVGNGDVRTQPVNPKNVVLWNCGTTGLLTIIELMSTREPRSRARTHVCRVLPAAWNGAVGGLHRRWAPRSHCRWSTSATSSQLAATSPRLSFRSCSPGLEGISHSPGWPARHSSRSSGAAEPTRLQRTRQSRPDFLSYDPTVAIRIPPLILPSSAVTRSALGSRRPKMTRVGDGETEL